MLSAPRRRNSLDHLRLLFAALVIFSHSFDIVGRHDPLYLFSGGNVAFGGFSVCGFFGISGYLIAQSWDRGRDLPAYLRNRALRIVPGFALAFILSVLVAGALGAADVRGYYAALPWPKLGVELLTLHEPSAPLPGPYGLVNGPLWTIRYEFFCYLLTPLLLFRRVAMPLLWPIVALLAATSEMHFPTWLLMFLSGAIVHAYGIRPTLRGAIIAGPLCVAALPFGSLWEIGLATFGVYTILAIGLRQSPLHGRSPDFSYGTYLYGWPTQKLLVLAGLGNPWIVALVAVPVSMVFGLASWFAIEERCLRMKRRSSEQIPRADGGASPAKAVRA